MKPLTFSLCKPSIHTLFSLAGCCIFLQAGVLSNGKKMEDMSACLHCSTLQKPCRWQQGRSPVHLLRHSLAVIHLLRLSRFHHENPCLCGSAVRQAWTSPPAVGCPHPPVLCRRAHSGLATPHRAVGNMRLRPQTELLLRER